MSYNYISSTTGMDLAQSYKAQIEQALDVSEKICSLHPDSDIRIRQLIDIIDSNNLAKQAYLQGLAKIERENAMILEEMKRMTGMPNTSPLASPEYHIDNDDVLENDTDQESGFYEEN